MATLILVTGIASWSAFSLFKSGEGIAAAGGLMYCAFALVGLVGLGVMAMLNGVASTDDVKALINDQRMATKALVTAMETEHRMATKALIAAIERGRGAIAVEALTESGVAPMPPAQPAPVT